MGNNNVPPLSDQRGASIQPSAAKWNILGTNDAYFDSLIGSGTAWATYSQSYAGFSLGNGTLNYSKYQQRGKNVYFRVKVTLGSTSSVSGQIQIALPVAAHADYSDTTDTFNVTGTVLDSGTAVFPIFVRRASSTSISLSTLNSTSMIATSSTSPMTWTTSDAFVVNGFYESA